MTGTADGCGPPHRPEDFGIGRLFWAIRDAIIVGDAASGQIALFNPAAEALFGYAEAEAVGRPLEMLVPEQLRGAHRAGLRRFRETGRGPLIGGRAPVEVVGLAKGGRQVALELSLSPIDGEAPDGRFVLAVIRDVTGRRRAAEAEAAERHARALIDTAPVMLWTAGPDGGRAYLNGAWLDFTGRDPERELGEGWTEAVHPEDRARLLRAFRDAVRVRGPFRSEYRLRRADGAYRWVLDSARPRLGPDGEFLGFVGSAVDIAERREAEEGLRRSEERYRAFVGRSSEGIWRFELERPCSVEWPEERQIGHWYAHAYLAECNDAMARMYGYGRAEDLVGARLGDLLPPADPASFAYLTAFIRAGYRLEDAESQEVDRDGNTKYFLNNLVGIVEGGLLVRAWGTQRDVTERRRIEAELRSSQERLTLASQAAGLGTFEWNIRTNEVFWTAEEEALYGLPPGGFGGSYENWRRAVHPDDLERAEGDVLRAAAEGGDLDTEYRIVRPDGGTRWIAARGRVFRDARGRPLRMIGVNEDITERKRAEEELGRFKAISDYAIDAHFVIDRDAGIRYANRAAAAGLGYSEAELLAMRVPDIDPRFSVERFRARFALGAGASVPRFESIHLRKDGSDFPVEVSAAILEFGGEPFMCSIVRDLSGREALLAAERAARAEAETAVRARDEFLSVAAHELRTPLTTLTAHVQLLLRGAAREGTLDRGRVLRSLRTMEHEAGRLSRLIAQLLDISRLDAGRLQPEWQETDLRRLVDGVAAGAQARTDRHQIEVTGPPRLPARVDPLRIEQVLASLLDNAIRYSPAGPIEVRLSAEAQGRVKLSVRDRGQGIPPERRAGLFERFYQAHAHSHSSGMGLGLYISRQIVELHGGEIRAEFPEDGGIRFVVGLPSSAPDDQATG